MVMMMRMMMMMMMMGDITDDNYDEHVQALEG